MTTLVSRTRSHKICSNTDLHADVWQGALWWAAGPWWGDYMYGLEPTAGVAYNAYVPILQSAFAVSGSNPTTTTTTTRGSTTTTSRATTTTTKATTATTTSRVTSTGTTSLPSPTGACAARYGQCGVSRCPQHIEENNLNLTKYRATAGQARHAARADRLALRRTIGTPNACRCETWRVDSSCGAPNLAKSRHYTLWNLVCTRAKPRTRPSSRSFVPCRR